MVAIPQWADQPTTAKFVESAWGIGLRARRDGKGLVRREEIERCIKEVLGGEEYKRNASKWMQKAKSSMQKGGSSDKNITDFVAKYLPNSRSYEDGDS
jgi:UDP:flavonoid glycosyltransferase YjiC (YdhE family)